MHTLFVLTTADSEDPDEMPHTSAFYQALHCLFRQKRSSEKKKYTLFGNCNCDPSNYAMDHSKFMESIQKDKSISA